MKGKIRKAILVSQGILLGLSPMTVHANGSVSIDKVEIKAPDNNLDLLGNIVGVVLGLFQFVGIGMVLLGVAQFVQAMHDDQPDKKIKALTLCGCGCVMAALRFVLQQMGLIA